VGIRLAVLASGSRGNSIYVSTAQVRVLIDAGLSGRELERRLDLIGARAEDLDAILVTHEHVDHVRGLGPLSRRHRLPVYLSRVTHESLPEEVGRLSDRVQFWPGKTFSLGDLVIHPFSISHDAADPVGLTLINGASKVGVCTDLGKATRLVHHHLRECRLLVLEANHDVEMLNSGPYPWPVKQRIRSDSGHLSNEESGEVLIRVLSEGLEQVILAHLSEVNNRPDLVLRGFRNLLRHCGSEQIKLAVASQHQPLEPISLP
jgi:phosphoribosyl 1,2-cyclic phosphodiesterase